MEQNNVNTARSGVRFVSEPDEWRRYHAQLPEPHVLQAWEWGELKEQTGWSVKRFALFQDGNEFQNRIELVGTFQLLTRRAPMNLPFTIGYVPKGPTLDWLDPCAVDMALESIQKIARRERCLFVKLDPNVSEDAAEGTVLLQKLRLNGWTYSPEQIQFKNTAYSTLGSVDTGGAEAMLAQMKNKWRYNIRLAERREISIREGDEPDLHILYQLYSETSRRDGFAIRPFSYYETIWKRFLLAQAESENPLGGTLMLAEHPEEESPVAGLFLFKYGERVWYFYGASSHRRRRDMPNYLLQWRALTWALEQGASLYDWWGAPTDPNDPNDGMAGVWRFKKGFGAELQNHIGAWDWAPVPIFYRCYHLVRRHLG